VIVAEAVAKPEPREARMLVGVGSSVLAQTPAGTRKVLLKGAREAVFSPDGTLVAFIRAGDLWTANSDGTGERRLVASPNVVESSPSWLLDGRALVYTATVDGRRHIRVLQLPTGPSKRIAASNAEEYDAAISAQGRLAFVSTRSGVPAVYVAQPNGFGATAFDTTPPATPFTDIHDLAWSPDGTKLAYSADQQDATRVIVLDDGTTQAVLPLGDRPTWAPEGTRIAFAASTGLASVALDGSDLRTLGAGTPFDWKTVPIGAPKFPNLVQRPPSGLVLGGSRGRWSLGFTSMVDNRGPGIVWIRATRKPGARVMQVRQLIQLGTGGARVDPASGELHYVVAPPHYHWHFLGFDHYELRSAKDFKLRVRDYKSGFCIADHWGHAIGVPHGPPRFLSNCEQFNPRARYVEEGSSVGYTDRYPAFFHGQQLNITHLRAGLYWLVHRANEDFHLREARYDDDAASLLIRLSWRSGVPSVTTIRSCLRERC
jgi:fructose-specific component phosphotransferase system IIB-like protein